MKKILCIIISFLIFAPCTIAATQNGKISNHNHPHHHPSSSSSSHPVYLVRKDIKKDEIKFQDCNEHYALQETITDFYSDNSKHIYTNSNVYNQDGTLLLSDCRKVEHIIFEDQHYFIVYDKKGANIYDSKANPITIRKYSSIEKIEPNRLLVKYNKRYGIIDLKEHIIVPVKYQSLSKFGHSMFISKLNGYYGIIDINNNIILDNDCEKIKPLYDTYIVKRYNKYGLYDINANKITEINNDKISALGEFIIVKNNNRYSIYDYAGKPFSNNSYKKIRLKRNHIQYMDNRGKWHDINNIGKA